MNAFHEEKSLECLAILQGEHFSVCLLHKTQQGGKNSLLRENSKSDVKIKRSTHLLQKSKNIVHIQMYISVQHYVWYHCWQGIVEETHFGIEGFITIEQLNRAIIHPLLWNDCTMVVSWLDLKCDGEILLLSSFIVI